MAKTEEELKALRERVEALGKELDGLSDEELDYVAGGHTGQGTCGFLCKKTVRNEPEAKDIEIRTAGITVKPFDRTIKPIK